MLHTLFDKNLENNKRKVGVKIHFDTELTKEELEINFTPWEQSVEDMAAALIKTGYVKFEA